MSGLTTNTGDLNQQHEWSLRECQNSIASSLSRAALLCYEVGDYRKAEEYEEEVKRRFEGSHGDDAMRDYLCSASRLALYRLGAGKLKQTLELGEQTLQSQKNLKQVGLDHINTFETMSILLKIYLSLGKYDQVQTMSQAILQG
ncbi:17023_t:CDS:1, partial [Acaulospora colombiana]